MLCNVILHSLTSGMAHFSSKNFRIEVSDVNTQDFTLLIIRFQNSCQQNTT